MLSILMTDSLPLLYVVSGDCKLVDATPLVSTRSIDTVEQPSPSEQQAWTQAAATAKEKGNKSFQEGKHANALHLYTVSTET